MRNFKLKKPFYCVKKACETMHAFYSMKYATTYKYF